jgi:hypothetical protein
MTISYDPMWWQEYDAAAQRRHKAYMRAFDHVNGWWIGDEPTIEKMEN